jgi:hypothetical protein
MLLNYIKAITPLSSLGDCLNSYLYLFRFVMNTSHSFLSSFFSHQDMALSVGFIKNAFAFVWCFIATFYIPNIFLGKGGRGDNNILNCVDMAFICTYQ